MADKKVWFITGAGRGLGLEITKAALAYGHKVVATGRNPEKVSKALGHHQNLIVVKLDITRPEEASAAVNTAIKEFGAVDVLVNNAGNFVAGYFEELQTEQIRQQLETLLFGPMNVTRAVLPVMRQQKNGLIIIISSTAGIMGGAFCSAYAAGKFAVEGWVESLSQEIQPFGIRSMLVEPGYFRTELLSSDSTEFAAGSIGDYSAETLKFRSAFNNKNGQQEGDPVKLAEAIVNLSGLESPPLRFAAGKDALDVFENKARALLSQVDAYRQLSTSLDVNDV